MRKLTVDDIVDHRAYERERDEFRAAIIAMKKRRRIALGDLVTIVFENTDTMRFQVQEMARAERMLTDDAIAGEVATYNELIPDPGELSGTLFIELTTDELLREWLPKLREHRVRACASTSGRATRNASRVIGVPRDEERLTRDDITSTVHYLRFPFDAAAARAARHRSGAARGRPPRVQGRGWSSPTRSAPSSPATSPTDAGPDQGPAARSGAAAPAPAAHRRRRLRPPRPRARRARAGRGTGAGAHRARGRDPVGLRGLRAARAPGWR